MPDQPDQPDRPDDARPTYAELEAEILRLKRLLDRDHTGLASALAAVRRLVNHGYGWIPLGEWGSYEHHERSEKALRQEVGNCFDEIDTLAETALRESGTRAGAAFVADRDKLASAEAERDEGTKIIQDQAAEMKRLRNIIDSLTAQRRRQSGSDEAKEGA